MIRALEVRGAGGRHGLLLRARIGDYFELNGEMPSYTRGQGIFHLFTLAAVLPLLAPSIALQAPNGLIGSSDAGHPCP